MKFIKYNSNTCDRICNELMIQLTKSCPNSCSFCIDKLNHGVHGIPDFEAIKARILEYADKSTNITISGGEPLIYINEVLDLVKFIKKYTKLNITINTSIPYECYLHKAIYNEIVENVDSILLSAQHRDQEIADKIRKSKSKFDRNAFYKELPHKEKYIVSLNIHKPYLCKLYDILRNIEFFYNLGFDNIKLAELFERPEMYVSISKILGIKLPQPFAVQCSNKNVDISHLLPNFKGNLTIKTVCFIKSKNLKANFWDLFKTATRNLFRHKTYFFGVIQPDGNIYPYWI